MADYPIYRIGKGSQLTFEEMDNNLNWLSQNMSGSQLAITGSAINITGSIAVDGEIQFLGTGSIKTKHLTLTNLTGVTYTEFITFTKTDYGSEVDEIIPGVLEITRGNNQGIYNAALEASFDNDDYTSPANTLWNSCETSVVCGWSNMENVFEEDRSYYQWSDAVDYYPPGQIDQELVFYETTTNRIFQIKFLSWTQGAEGGGFSYDRREVVLPLPGEITFADGTSISSVNDIYPPNDLYATVGSSTVFLDDISQVTLPYLYQNWMIRIFRNGSLLDYQDQGASDPYFDYDASTGQITLSSNTVTGEKFVVIAYKKA
jgi:hypothetical protein